MKDEIRALADRYAAELKLNIDARVADMEQDDQSHVLIYEVLDPAFEEVTEDAEEAGKARQTRASGADCAEPPH